MDRKTPKFDIKIQAKVRMDQDAHDLSILNCNAVRLNEKASEVLAFQVWRKLGDSMLFEVDAFEFGLQDSTQLRPGAEYPVWSPLDAYDAAETLSSMLVEHRKKTQTQ